MLYYTRKRTNVLRKSLCGGKSDSTSNSSDMQEHRIVQGADRLTVAERSALMAKVKSSGTKPEEKVRKTLFHEGFRYRKNVSRLPGKPDIVLPKYRAIIFVHGCFWHRHEGCPLARLPKSRRDFWTTKLEGNRERDARKVAELENAGWRVFVVWECELKNLDTLAQRLRRFLDGGET